MSFISPTHIQWKTIKNKQKRKVIVNKLHHIISIGLSHSNKNDSGTFSPSIKELLNKIQLNLEWLWIDAKKVKLFRACHCMVTTVMRRPSSLRKVSASAHIGPKDSIAIGTKI